MTKQELINKIKEFEGFRSEAYADCGRGVCTIGYGRTIGVKQGDKTTREAEENYLLTSVNTIMNKVKDNLDLWGYSYNDSILFALTDFVYNCGILNLRNLTDNGNRSMETIKEKILLYNKAGGKELAGLTKRRNWEASIMILEDSEEKKKVKKLQEFINMSEYYHSEPLKIDGIIGNKTISALLEIFENI